MKKTLASLFVILLILAGTYSAAWFYAKHLIEDEIDRLFAQAPAQNIQFLGDKPPVTGFPFAPTLHYTDGIKVRNWQVSFNDMFIKGYPLPGMPLRVSFPGGIIGWIDGTQDSLALKELDVLVRIPNPLPASFRETDLRLWQAAGGTLDIINSLIRYEAASMNVAGTLALDTDLQITAELQTQIRGYAPLLQKMVADETIKPFAGFALMAALNNFSAPAEGGDTQDNVASLPVRIVNRDAYAGPVLVGTLPRIIWDAPGSPAPLMDPAAP